MVKNNNGITLIELLVVIAAISILALLTAPEIGRFRSNYNVRSCATDLIQNMRVARAMAIKENREYLMVFDTNNERYLIGVDVDGDNDLTTVSSANNGDTFGICRDADGDRLPDNDSDANNDGVPDCVMVVNFFDCGDKVRYGTLASKDPMGDDVNCNGKTVCFGATSSPIRTNFNPDGSVGLLGSAYLEHNNASDEGRGYSYVVRISSNAGAMSLFKWDGDIGNQSETDWTEIR